MMNTIAAQEPFVLANHLIGLTGVESARLLFCTPADGTGRSRPCLPGWPDRQ